jgi:hypothetical protein
MTNALQLMCRGKSHKKHKAVIRKELHGEKRELRVKK